MPFGGLLTSTLIGAGAKIFGGIQNSNAVTNATDTQANAEKQLLALINQTVPQANSLIAGGTQGANQTLADFYAKNMGLLQPYLDAGSAAEGQLSKGLQPGGTFNTPVTADQLMKDDPGYNFRLQQGTQALDRSASSRGGVLGGGQLKALTQFGQDYGSNEYNNAFQRYNTTQSNLFNRLNSVAGTGLSAAGTGVGAGTATGTAEAGNTMAGSGMQASNLLQALGIQGNAITGAANATASGYVGRANALNDTLGGVAQTAQGAYGAYQGQQKAKQDQQNFQQLLQALMQKTNGG